LSWDTARLLVQWPGCLAERTAHLALRPSISTQKIQVQPLWRFFVLEVDKLIPTDASLYFLLLHLQHGLEGSRVKVLLRIVDGVRGEVRHVGLNRSLRVLQDAVVLHSLFHLMLERELNRFGRAN